MELRISLVALLFFCIMNSSAQININTRIVTFSFQENEYFPNNPKLPVLIYQKVFDEQRVTPEDIELVLYRNNWRYSWRNGIYTFHHYHSTAHEVLVVYSGWAEVQLGGPNQEILRIEKGDLVILPAGTAHKKINSGDGFAVIGAYPDQQAWDMNYGKPEETEQAKNNIEKVKIPGKDPIFGNQGPVFEHWK